jgi:two-component system chemotaxis sensor kinase CheA
MDYSFFDSLLDAVFVLDSQKRIRYCNVSAATLCDSSVRRLTKGDGVPLYDVLEVSDHRSFVNKAGDYGKTELAPWSEVDFRLLKAEKSGKIQVSVQPFSDPQGQSRWIVTCHDVTLEETLHQKYQGELEQKEEMINELRDARGKLEKYSKNLEQMVEDRTQELRRANSMLKAIMDSLGQGFLVFNRLGHCGQIYTKACLDILESDPNGKTIDAVLSLRGDEKAQFDKWMAATFSQALPFTSMKELAPQFYEHSKGKHIVLDYFPIEAEDGQLSNILLVATDKTSEFEANKALEKERHYARMIVKMVKNKGQFSDFLDSAKELISGLRKSTQSKPREFWDHEEMFRLLHTLEGEAGAFHVNSLRISSRACQEALEPIRTLEADSLDVEKFIQELEQMDLCLQFFLKENHDILSLILSDKSELAEVSLDEINGFFKALRKANIGTSLLTHFQESFYKQDLKRALLHLDDVAQQVALKQNKELKPVEFLNQNVRVFPEIYKDLLSSLVHVFRNAVDHGIENPAEREVFGKAREGHIQVRSQRIYRSGMSWIQIVIQDDGRGVDPERIRKKLEENGVPTTDLNDHEVIQKIFDPGFTSRDQVSEFSGRGVGMDAVRTEAERLNGHVHVTSDVGQGTKITIEIPELSRENVYSLVA